MWMLNHVVPLPENGKSRHYFMSFSNKYEVIENIGLYIDLDLDISLLVY